MKPFLKITIIYTDLPDLIEVNIQANNGYFSGIIELYTHPDHLKELAGLLQGFPSEKEDVREFELGTFDPKYAGGGARLKFRCTDSLGHAIVETTLQMDLPKANGQSVYLMIPCVAANIDDFIQQLLKLSNEIHGSAELNSSF